MLKQPVGRRVAMRTYVFFFGISELSDVVISVRGRREYAETFLGRLKMTPAASSGSELLSGAARFLPLRSRMGSLMIRAVEFGKVARRALRNHESAMPRYLSQIDQCLPFASPNCRFVSEVLGFSLAFHVRITSTLCSGGLLRRSGSASGNRRVE